MHELLLYEYAIIRIVPRVEREEFLNAGVIIFCKSKKLLKCKIYVNEHKLSCLSPNDYDLTEIQSHLNSFQDIADGIETSNPISSLEIASRFRWLTAIRSTVIQCSRIHPGRSPDPGKELERLFHRMVL